MHDLSLWERFKKLLSSRASAVDAAITVKSQKWLAPGETLRIVELNCEGDCRRLVLWSSKAGLQMLELPANHVESRSLGRSAACQS